MLPQALRRDLLSPGEYLLADGGYTVMKHVIMPYSRMPGQSLTPAQERWNFNLSRCRIAIEQAFGMGQSRFESLRDLPIQIDTDRDQNRAHLEMHNRVILQNFLINEAANDSFWEDRAGLKGMLEALDRLRESIAVDRREYERKTGTCPDMIADRGNLDELVTDPSMRELIQLSAEGDHIEHTITKTEV